MCPIYLKEANINYIVLEFEISLETIERHNFVDTSKSFYKDYVIVDGKFLSAFLFGCCLVYFCELVSIHILITVCYIEEEIFFMMFL